ncbi:hypothetical protein Ahy_B02g057733 [Arachis hypogaea]|uniref:Reverse transcriptase zinc-binding domain-containing protein n=1 Tax=Arachis hypogaea TaxID=3818 RepID=A0A445ACU9_ARAHY|nr:hypothetical protein Ahy_B02g057733 [Arachis hypogaea]
MDSNYNPFPLSGYFPKLVSRNYADISKEVSQEKVKAASFYIKSWKALGSDENGFVISSKSLKRLKTFCWLLTHEALLTNNRRKSRNLIDNNDYLRCCGEEETVLHALRDCLYICTAWISIEWLSTNLSLVSRKQYGTPWPIIFVTTCNIV